MFEVFGQDLRTEQALVQDQERVPVFGPGQDTRIYRVLEDVPCFLDEARYSIFSHSSMEILLVF
jgi:hypothetical protein